MQRTDREQQDSSPACRVQPLAHASGAGEDRVHHAAAGTASTLGSGRNRSAIRKAPMPIAKAPT